MKLLFSNQASKTINNCLRISQIFPLIACAMIIAPIQAHAQTQISTATLDQAKQTITQACPQRWSTVDEKLVIPELASDAIWVDATDRQAFVDYINPIITQTNSQANAEQIADDVPSVAAECATARTALLDLLLVKEPNDVILGMRALKKTLENQAAFAKDGSSQDLAAKSCLAIKQGFEQSEDGTYWVDFDGAGSSVEPQEVYCDMTTDGGGWTFVAYVTTDDVNVSSGFRTMFEEPIGFYDVERKRGSKHFSLGHFDQLSDTEMMMTIDTPDAQTAYDSKRFVRFRYNKQSPMFNYGPIPCTKSNMEIAYSINNPNFRPAIAPLCTNTRMYWAGIGEYYSVLFMAEGDNNNGLHYGWSVVQRGGTYALTRGGQFWIYIR